MQVTSMRNYPGSYRVHLYFCLSTIIYKTSFPITVMHISIADDLKKRFHAACVLRGRKMSQVVTELIEQWLKTDDALGRKKSI